MSLISCNWEAQEFEDDTEKIEFNVSTRSSEISEDADLVAIIFKLDTNSNGIVDYEYQRNEQLKLSLGSTLLELVKGKYSIYFVANADNEDIYVPNIENIYPRKIMLKASNDETDPGPKNFFICNKEFEVLENNNSPSINLDFKRCVAYINMSITKVKSTITDLAFVVEGTPSKYSITCDSCSNASTITKKISTFSSGDASAESSAYVFPVAENKTKTGVLYTENQVTRQSLIDFDSSIPGNKKVNFNFVFEPLEKSYFAFTFENWDDLELTGTGIINGKETIISDERPITGSPNPINIVDNNSLEEWDSSTGLPVGWKYDNDEDACQKDSLIVKSGKYSLKISGKSYVYVDVPVVGGESYQIIANVYCSSEDYKWKNWFTWHRIASQDIDTSQDDILKSEYQNLTNGWRTVFDRDNDYFRAPVDANFIRLMFKGYSKDTDGALYIDDIEIHHLE